MWHRQPLRFRILAAATLVIGLYHLAALTIPAFAQIAYPPNYPALRHIVFIFIDILFAYLFLANRRILLWPYLLVTAQVLYSHGSRAGRWWIIDHRVDWISLIFIPAVLMGLAFLWHDRKAAHSSSTPALS